VIIASTGPSQAIGFSVAGMVPIEVDIPFGTGLRQNTFQLTERNIQIEVKPVRFFAKQGFVVKIDISPDIECSIGLFLAVEN